MSFTSTDPVYLVEQLTNGQTGTRLDRHLTQQLFDVLTDRKKSKEDQQYAGQAVVQTLQDRLLTIKQQEIRLQCVALLRVLMKYTPKPVIKYIATNNFLTVLIDVLPKRVRDPQNSVYKLTTKPIDAIKLERSDAVLQLIQQWANRSELHRHYPIFLESYRDLQRRGVRFPDHLTDDQRYSLSADAAQTPENDTVEQKQRRLKDEFRKDSVFVDDQRGGGSGRHSRRTSSVTSLVPIITNFTDDECQRAHANLQQLYRLTYAAIRGQYTDSLNEDGAVQSLLNALRKNAVSFNRRLKHASELDDTTVHEINAVNSTLVDVIELYQQVTTQHESIDDQEHTVEVSEEQLRRLCTKLGLDFRQLKRDGGRSSYDEQQTQLAVIPSSASNTSSSKAKSDKRRATTGGQPNNTKTQQPILDLDIFGSSNKDALETAQSAPADTTDSWMTDFEPRANGSASANQHRRNQTQPAINNSTQRNGADVDPFATSNNTHAAGSDPFSKFSQMKSSITEEDDPFAPKPAAARRATQPASFNHPPSYIPPQQQHNRQPSQQQTSAFSFQPSYAPAGSSSFTSPLSANQAQQFQAYQQQNQLTTPFDSPVNQPRSVQSKSPLPFNDDPFAAPQQSKQQPQQSQAYNFDDPFASFGSTATAKPNGQPRQQPQQQQSQMFDPFMS